MDVASTKIIFNFEIMQELQVQLQESHNSEAEFTREWLSILEKKSLIDLKD